MQLAWLRAVLNVCALQAADYLSGMVQKAVYVVPLRLMCVAASPQIKSRVAGSSVRGRVYGCVFDFL